MLVHQVWQSKDLLKTGTEEEVREYERKQEDPLSSMRFPYRFEPNQSTFVSCDEHFLLTSERKAFVAFANLAPVIAKWRAEKGELTHNWYTDDATNLIRAYDEACEVARKVNG